MKRALCVALLAAACGGSTGNDHVHFNAAAAGPADATGAPLDFTTAIGWHVVLTKAQLHVGALYLNDEKPISGEQPVGCYLKGVYVAQVPGAVDLDLLSPTPVPFPVAGDGLAIAALTAQVWLTGGAIDAATDPTVILAVEGTADKDGTTVPFTGAITISANRYRASTDPTLPSEHPLCLERIVTPIAVDLTPRAGATLMLRVDPRQYFLTVDFTKIPTDPDHPGHFKFADAGTNDADVSLWNQLRAIDGVYSLELQ